MGGAMLRGLMKQAPQHTYSIIKPSPHSFENVGYAGSIEDGATILGNADIVFLAVKPQIMHEIMAEAAPHISAETLIISIAAGLKLAQYETVFAKNPIIRTLPNTPSAVGKGMNLLIANDKVNDNDTSNTNTLFETLGKTYWLNQEDDMDAASAISASGPAYIFYLIEAIAKAGESIGLPEDVSMALARQTVIGAAALAEEDSETPAQTLRENVTSAKGMTAEALNVLMNGELQQILNTALAAARDRSKELGQ